MPRPLFWFQLALAALLLPSILFLTAPISIIAGNQQDVTFYQSDLHMAWSLFAAFSGVIAVLLLILRGAGRLLALQLIGALSINIVIWNILFPYVWVHTVAQLALLAAAEFCFFVASLWLLRRVPAALILKTVAIFAVLNTALAVYQNGALASKLPESEAAVSHTPASTPTGAVGSVREAKGNVYHVVLDAFSREYLAYRLRNGDDLGLDGYTFYERAITSYGRTNLSMRAVFRGSLHGAGLVGWGNGAFTEGFTRDLSEAGIQQYFFPFYRGYCNENVIVCSATQDLYGQVVQNAGETILTDIVFLKALPVSLRDLMMGSLGTEERDTETWEYGFSVSSLLRRESGGGDYPLWRRPIQSLTMNTLAEFKTMEPALPASGRYVFLHMMVPHGPVAFDPDCRFVDPKMLVAKDARQAMEDHVACAVNVVAQITHLLKELGRFDNSLIIVHSDHGTGAGMCAWWNADYVTDAKQVNRDEEPDKLLSGQVGCLAHALLLVKAPGQKTFDVSSKPLQLIDIAPTVLDYFGLPYQQYPGVSAISAGPVPQRETVYFEAETNDLPKIDYFARYLFDGKTWKFDTRVPVVKNTSS